MSTITDTTTTDTTDTTTGTTTTTTDTTTTATTTTATATSELESTGLSRAIDLDRLCHAVATDGFAPHDAEVAQLVEWLHRTRPDEPSVSALGDRSSPEVVRARALAAITRHLTAVEARTRFDDTYAELAAAWDEHRRLRAESAAPARLWASRGRPDGVRVAMTARRRAVEAGFADDTSSAA